MAQQFKNNARSILVASITADSTSIVIEADKADLFPVANVGPNALPSAGSWFKLVLQDANGNVEIVAVRTKAAGSSLLTNVIRGYEGTVARAFVTGTIVGLRVTADDLQTALSVPAQDNVFSGDNSFVGANAFSGSQTLSGVTNISGTTALSGTIAFNSSPTAPTAAYGNNTTTVATTAFVQQALKLLYPVGCIYTSTAITNPNALFGFGTWSAFGAGRVLIGYGNGFSAGATGGSADAVLVAHSHSASTSINDPGHVHALDGGYIKNQAGSQGANGTSRLTGTQTNAAATGISASTSIGSAGGSGTNANLQPYIVVYMWTRIA